MRSSALSHLILVLVCLYAGVKSQCVTFYGDYNQGGDSFELCSSGNVPSNWNDQVSSFVVPSGYSVTLYQDYNYGGQRVGPYRSGSHNVPSDFNDQLSSVTITRNQDQNRNCVTFYADYNQQGDSFQLCSSGGVPSNWNDQVSSFVVPSGYSVELYQDYNYGGRSVGPYNAGSYNVPSDFNDQLSSVRISRGQSRPRPPQPQPQPRPPQQNCPTFYDHKNLRGDSFQMCSSGDVPQQWSNEATSFVVPAGFTVYLYQYDDFEGESLGPYTQGVYNIPDYFNNRLSSVRVSNGQPKPPARNCPTFYRDYDQQGDSFQLCSSDDVPSEWNDQVSSFYVPRGYYVRLYQDYDFDGRVLGPYGQGYYNVPADFNDQLSSVSIRRR